MEYKLQNFSSPMTVSRIANVHYFEFTGEYHTTDDAHNFCELLYVDKGTLHIHSEHYTGILESNQLIIHRANETHSLTCTENAYPHVMIIGFECHSPELYSFSQKPVTLRPAHRRQLAEVMKEGTNLFAPPYDIPNTPKMKKRKHYLFGADQMLKIHLESFLINLVRDKALLQAAAPETVFTENRLGEIRNYIEEHYTEKILLDNICFLFGKRCRLLREVLLPNTIFAYIFFIFIDIAINNVIPIRTADGLFKRKIQHLIVLTQMPHICLISCKTGTMYT